MRGRKGFGLMELLVVLAILGILVGIGTPAYLDYLRKGRRSEAMSFLNRVLGEQQKYRTQCGQYADTLTGAYSCAPGDYTLGLDTATTAEGFYNVLIMQADATGFTAQAVGQSSQADDAVDGNDCSRLTLELNQGQVSHTPVVCWRQ